MLSIEGHPNVYCESALDVVCADCAAPVGSDCRQGGRAVFSHRIRQAHAERYHQLHDLARERKPWWPRNKSLLRLARSGSP